MAKSGRRTKKREISYLLESGTLADLRKAKSDTEKLLKYQWMYYSELAQQRSEIQDKIRDALIQTAIAYEINNWQRAVKYKYGLHPLSTVGSLTFIGGRFNTGKGVNTEVPVFSGLYIAQDKDTALQEHLGQISNANGLTPREVALTNPSSESIVSISGKFDKIFDLTNYENLEPFVKLINKFKISKGLKIIAHELGLPNPEIIKTSKKLGETLLIPDWRTVPANFDVPSNSQIFGHLITLAGIEGILYPSKLTKKPCLVVYPQNFVATDSYLELDDDTPHYKVPKRLNSTNWRICELTPEEIFTDK